MDVNAHFVRKITAIAHHAAKTADNRETNWITVTLHEDSYGKPAESVIQVFMDGPDAHLRACRYVAAIEAVNEQFEAEELARSEAA